MPALIVSYGHPADPAAFDTYYTTTHRELADQIPGVTRWRAGHCASPDGSRPEHHLVAVLEFGTMEALQAGLGSPQGQAAVADIPNFATGGASTTVISDLLQ
ncbi:EthD family reductase [Gordonia sp. NPDC003376]